MLPFLVQQQLSKVRCAPLLVLPEPGRRGVPLSARSASPAHLGIVLSFCLFLSFHLLLVIAAALVARQTARFRALKAAGGAAVEHFD